MTPIEATNILDQHSAWRRLDGDMEMFPPSQIGEAMDVVCAAVRRYQHAPEAIAKKTTSEQKVVEYMQNSSADRCKSHWSIFATEIQGIADVALEGDYDVEVEG